MNRKTLWQGFFSAAAALLLAVCPSGCNEDDPDTSQLDDYFATHPFVSDPRGGSSSVNISPDGATINTVGGKQAFNVTGGSGGYHWDVANDSVGTVSPGSGAQTVYTSKAIGENDVIVYDSSGMAAIAHITGTPPPAMKITADPGTLEMNGDMAVLTVSGGSPPYTWTLSEVDRGIFPKGNTGVSVLYQRYGAGDNGVIVEDGKHDTASIVIKQP